MIKELDEISREEWIDNEWAEITELGDRKRKFVLCGKSTPFERARKIGEYEYLDREDARRGKAVE